MTKPIFIHLTVGVNSKARVAIGQVVSYYKVGSTTTVLTSNPNPNLSILMVPETPEEIDQLIEDAVSGKVKHLPVAKAS